MFHKTDDWWWIGWMKEIMGVNAQERTREGFLWAWVCALKDMLDLDAAVASDSSTDEGKQVKVVV